MSTKIISKAKFVHIVFVRIADANDLIAAEGCYHPNCLKRFFREAETAEMDCRSADLAVIWLVQELRRHAIQGHLLDLSEVFSRYKELASEIDIEVPSSYFSRLATFKETLCKFIGGVYDFVVLRNVSPTDRKTLLIPNTLHHVPLSNLVVDDSNNDTIPIFRHNDDDFMKMVHVALKLRGDIIAHPGFKGVNVSEMAEVASVPSSVHTFISLLLGGQMDTEKEFDECDVQELELIRKSRVLSIGQDLVFGVCGSKKAPPKHIGLGLSLHEATRSKQLVDLFHKAGHVISYVVATLDIQESLINAEKLGQQQLSDFVSQRLVERSVKLMDTMLKSKVLTFRSLCVISKDAAKKKTEVLKSDRQIFQRLIMAYQAGRPVDLDNILKHELVKVPPSIAEENGSLRSGNKAMLVDVLTKDVNCPPEIDIEDGNSCLVIDGQASVVAFGKPSDAKTFGDYADKFVNHILKTGRKFNRIDIAFDLYKNTGTSIKDGTREKRKKKKSCSIRRLVESREVPLPANWNDFLALSENKRDLAAFLSEELVRAAPSGRTVVVAGSSAMEVKASNSEIDVSMLRSDHEEADTRVILHCIHSAADHIVVLARDTDIAILLLAHFIKIPCETLWLKAGTSSKPKYIPIHEIWETFEQSVLDTILAFHAITGCDTVSYLKGHSKKTSWDVFLENHMLLQDIGKSEDLSEEGASMAEAFLCRIYKVPYDSCDKGRVHLFCKCKPPEALPPTSDAVRLHIQRANYQTFLWRQANISVPVVPSPISSGWRDTDGILKPMLTTLPPVPKACREIVFCGCTKGCVSKNCSCKKAGNLPCSAACKCSDGPVPCTNRK